MDKKAHVINIELPIYTSPPQIFFQYTLVWLLFCKVHHLYVVCQLDFYF